MNTYEVLFTDENIISAFHLRKHSIEHTDAPQKPSCV